MTTPALVLGSPAITTLSVIQELGRHGIPQFVVGAGASWVSRSRWHRTLPGTTGVESPASLLRWLEGIPSDRMVLIPCSDDWVAAVADLPPTLTERFPASLAPRESVHTYLDKGRLAETLAQLGLPHPRTVVIRGGDDLASVPDDLLQGSFLKPRDSLGFRTRFGAKGRWFATRAEAIVLAKEAEQTGFELLLQEYIPGPATRHCLIDGFVDRHGRVCARFARRRLRMSPPDFGSSTALVSVPLSDVASAVESLDALLAAMRHRGAFNAEFKHDERDGLFKLIEVNPRPWIHVAFAAACGVDVLPMVYRDALELPVEPVVSYSVGRHHAAYLSDWGSCRHLHRTGALTLRDWLGSWIGAIPPRRAWDDPVPHVSHFAERLQQRLAWRLGGSRQRPARPVT